MVKKSKRPSKKSLKDVPLREVKSSKKVYVEEDTVIKDAGAEVKPISDEELSAEMEDPVFGEKIEQED